MIDLVRYGWKVICKALQGLAFGRNDFMPVEGEKQASTLLGLVLA